MLKIRDFECMLHSLALVSDTTHQLYKPHPDDWRMGLDDEQLADDGCAGSHTNFEADGEKLRVGCVTYLLPHS